MKAKTRGLKKTRNAHTANTRFGMGDFYGSGVRAKVGRIRDVYDVGANPMSPKSLKNPPKSLA